VQPSITKKIVGKPIPNKIPTPRVQANTNTEIATTPPIPRVHNKPKEKLLDAAAPNSLKLNGP
jgi:hypothetical protein